MSFDPQLARPDRFCEALEKRSRLDADKIIAAVRADAQKSSHHSVWINLGPDIDSRVWEMVKAELEPEFGEIKYNKLQQLVTEKNPYRDQNYNARITLIVHDIMEKVAGIETRPERKVVVERLVQPDDRDVVAQRIVDEYGWIEVKFVEVPIDRSPEEQGRCRHEVHLLSQCSDAKS